MPSLDRFEKTTCAKCGLIAKKFNLSLHKNCCTKVTKACLTPPNFFCKTQSETNHRLTTKHVVSVLETKTNCLICEKDFPSFYSLQRHKKSEHGKLSRNPDLTVDLELIMGDYLDRKLLKELTDCQHFLVNYEFVGSRLHVFKFPSTNGTPSFLKDKWQHLFEILHCATKVNLALRVVLRDVEDWKFPDF